MKKLLILASFCLSLNAFADSESGKGRISVIGLKCVNQKLELSSNSLKNFRVWSGGERNLRLEALVQRLTLQPVEACTPELVNEIKREASDGFWYLNASVEANVKTKILKMTEDGFVRQVMVEEVVLAIETLKGDIVFKGDHAISYVFEMPIE